ncbi:hypothetical protein Cni_G21400 [Canna indica]|uniref:Uncharacterized protein n=1 Tax=Canna indica TaxID=4628 RepID=A0AAQ3KPF3_9LILI|nr:hypothetical protein Cni_G21400 [Canna indica]
MGTKVQCKSYLPGYHPTRDVNDDANFSWSPFCEDKSFSRQLYSDFKPRGISSWSVYDKEMLKRTMLQHEATFRNQVNELHHLYRIQKELMHELKRKELNRFYGPMETSKSSMFKSQIHPEFDEKMSHLHHLPIASTCWSTANGIDNSGKRAFINFPTEGANQFIHGGRFKNETQEDAKLNSFPKRILDLHLPADAYIKEEYAERTERENDVETPNPVCGIEADNDVKLTLSSVEVPGFEGSNIKSNLHSRNGLSAHRLTDLNMPFKDSCRKEAEDSDTGKFSGLCELYKENQQPWMSMESKITWQTNIFCDDSSNYLETEKVKVAQEWQPLHNCSGQNKIVVNSFNSDHFIDKYPVSSQSVKLKLDNAQQSQLPYPNQTKRAWLEEKPTHSTEISGSQDLLDLKVNPPLSVVPPFSYSVNASSSASPWVKPTKMVDHIPVAVQALPCFSTTSMFNGQSKSYEAFGQSNFADTDKLQCNGYGQQQKGLDNKSSSQNCHHAIQMNSASLTGNLFLQSNLGKPKLSKSDDNLKHEISETHEPRKYLKGLHSTDIKSAKDLNLNHGIACDTQDGGIGEQILVRKQDKLINGLIWLRERSSCNGSSITNERYTKSDLRSSTDYSQLLFTEFCGEGITNQGSSFCSSKHSISSFDVKESRIHMNHISMVPDSLGSGGIFSLSGNSLRNLDMSSSLSFDRESLADYEKGSVKGTTFRNCSAGLRNEINLNSELIPTTDNKLIGVSAEAERKVPSSLRLATVDNKRLCKIDLEAPADELEEDSAFTDIEVVDINCPKTTNELSQEKLSSEDICARLAADAIISMSMDLHSHLGKVTSYPSIPSSCDSLRLLAEVVAQNVQSCEASDDDDGLDVFESMTLKLEELTPDKYCSTPCQQEKPKDDEKSMASLLLSRPRRGQARKRRQKRDFQKDVLPALASLSRHEVTKDLQALGGIKRANKSQQTSSTRTSVRQTRGRRRPRSLVITIAEACDSPPQVQPIYTELENNGINIMTWGRTTRRCPRQRMPVTGNASAHE